MFVDQTRDGLYWKAEVYTALSTDDVAWPGMFKPTFAYSGAVVQDLGRVSVFEDVASLTAGEHVSAGVCLVGPDAIAKGSSEYVPYRVKGQMMGTANSAVPIFFVAIGPASPGADAAGYSVHYPIKLGDSGGANTMVGSSVNEIVYACPFGTVDSVDYSARCIVFGMAWANRSTGAILCESFGVLSVQRLDIAGPAVFDRRRP